MSVHRISAILFSTVFVAVSVLAVQLLLFARESGLHCESPSCVVLSIAGFPKVEPEDYSQSHSLTITDKRQYICSDGSCEEAADMSHVCDSWTEEPRESTTTKIWAYTRSSLQEPFVLLAYSVLVYGTGTYMDCSTSCR